MNSLANNDLSGASSGGTGSAVSNSRILVIDDMQSNIELIVANLRYADYDVVTAIDGATGIKKARIFKPDLIVLDLVMPKISGFDVCKTLKNDEETKNIMILVVTSMHSKESRMRAFEVGADDYMEKTFDRGMFLAKIKSLLRVKSLSDKLKENYSVLEEQSRQMEFQLEMARHVQQALIAEMSFTFNDVSFASCYRPVYSVGGDLYDVVTFDTSSIAVFMADVSGHGISAALLTSMLKIMFRNMVGSHKEAGKLLQQMNEEFTEIFERSSVNIYAAAFFALIDMDKKEIRYASAGASPPLFFNCAEGAARELETSGKPLGMMSDSAYITKTIAYEKGDMLFLHTDGLCDSFFKDEPDIFVEKLSELLVRAADNTPDEIIEEALGTFYNTGDDAKYQNDDVSIIVCKIE